MRAPLRRLMGAPEVPPGSVGGPNHAQAPAVLDHSCTLPQGDGNARPAFAGGVPLSGLCPFLRFELLDE
jgi:hypothetical protein